MKWISFFVLVLALGTHALTLKDSTWSIDVDPATLRMAAIGMEVASAAPAREVAGLTQDDTHAAWRYPAAKVAIDLTLRDQRLFVHFVSDDVGEFTWPILSGERGPEAYILPMFEGLYVPAEDEAFAEFLASQSPMDTTAGLSMGFVGVRHGEHTLTYLFDNPFNNE